MTATSLPLPLPLPSPARRTAFGKVVLNEARLTWRRPVGLIAGLALPLVLLVIFGVVPAFRQPSSALGGLTGLDLYLPILTALSLALLAFLGLPIPLVTQRQLGVLRRLSTTPVPPSWLLVAQGFVQLCIALTATFIILAVGVTVFGVPTPKSAAGLAVSVGLAIAGLFPIGLTIASVSRTATTANVIGRLVFFPLMFFAGLWLPRELMPGALQAISGFTPVGAAVQAMQDSMQTGFPPVTPLLVLVAYALFFGFLARRFFRWE